jgi:hypothetical protein
VGLADSAVGYVTSAVQLGFISGNADLRLAGGLRSLFAAARFFACSMLGALANLGPFLAGERLAPLLGFRFVTGFFLAGIYPVGMKIASGWYGRDLGNALGFLVGALVLGTAFPHLLKGLGQAWPWESVMLGVSATAALGGLLMLLLVPDGPHLAKAAKLDPAALAVIFRSRGFRASAFGYFGHMWELYAFWAFVPMALAVRPECGQCIALGFRGDRSRRNRLRRRRPCLAARGQRARGVCSACRLRRLLSCVPAVLPGASGRVPRVSDFLGHRCRRRLSAVLGAQRRQRTARMGRVRAYHRQLRRLRDYHSQHSSC